MDEQQRLIIEQTKGRCCSQAIMALALEDLGKENEDLITAMAGFCGGMGRGRICGSLVAAIAALHVCDTENASKLWQTEIMDWFFEKFGAYDCFDIIGNDPMRRNKVCPSLILATYLKLREYIA
jgi:hypothetical protein